MRHMYCAVTAAFFLSIPLWYLPNMVRDLRHPASWNWKPDPRIWFPALAVELIVIAGLYCSAGREDWRR